MSESSLQTTYKRGQLEWALWRAFVGGPIGVQKNPVPAFLTRIKRLLELDRSGSLYDAEVAPPVSLAFSELATDGTGNDAVLTLLDAWCLAIAMELLDMGFKQKEVVFFMRYQRLDLASRLPRILENPPRGGGPHRPKRQSGGATYRLPDKSETPDHHVFMLMRKVEITEVVPLLNRGAKQRAKKDDAPWFFEPIFCDGFDALRNTAIEKMPLHFRKVMVVEVAQLANDVQAFLERAPEIRRGPK